MAFLLVRFALGIFKHIRAGGEACRGYQRSDLLFAEVVAIFCRIQDI